MKRLLLILALVAMFASCRKSGVKLGAETDSLAYVIGMNMGKSLLQMDSTLNVDVVCTAIQDAFNGKEKMTFEEAKVYYLRQMNYTEFHSKDFEAYSQKIAKMTEEYGS